MVDFDFVIHDDFSGKLHSIEVGGSRDRYVGIGVKVKNGVVRLWERNGMGIAVELSIAKG